MVKAAQRIRRELVDIFWTVRGPALKLPAITERPKSILFVCKGNICRSPFAEHLASARWPAIAFGSAGLHVFQPTPPPSNAIQSARQYGLDMETHRSQQISNELVECHDMIIAMEAWQYSELRSMYKSHQHKIHVLAPYGNNGTEQKRGYAAFNIADPYGGQISDFDACFKRIDQCLTNLMSSIVS